MKSITSTANTLYRSVLRLATEPRAAREQHRCLAEGLHLAESVLRAGAGIEALLLRRGSRHAEVDRLAAAVLARGVQGYEFSGELYDRIAPVEHGAGLTLVVGVPVPPLPQKAARDMVYLDGVQDPGNVGTLLRTAAAAGIGDVLASPGTAAFWAPKTVRAGQGAHFRLRLHEQVAAELLPGVIAGPWIGAGARDGEPLWTAVLPRGAAGWVFGGEGAGISAAAIRQCAQWVTIPLDNAVESLNVAAAAAVCLFERRRRLSTIP
jgi:TrmH family RNA methyltransferase